MTPAQHRCLNFIRRYIAEHDGVSPSYDEIRDGMGLASKSRVHHIVRELMRRGYLYKEPGHARCLRAVEIKDSPHDGPVLAAALSIAAAYAGPKGPTPDQIRQLVQAYRRRERKLEEAVA